MARRRVFVTATGYIDVGRERRSNEPQQEEVQMDRKELRANAAKLVKSGLLHVDEAQRLVALVEGEPNGAPGVVLSEEQRETQRQREAASLIDTARRRAFQAGIEPPAILLAG